MKMTSMIRIITRFTAVLLVMAAMAYGAMVKPAAASNQEVDCLKCHAKLQSEKVVHPALAMGCTACHTGLDAKTVPHKITNKIANGLSSEPPDLCYGCHDNAMFTKKTVHPALDMGCTACHDPHSSKNAKLLKANPPELCFGCHDQAMFTKKTVHPPVAAGMCLSCHSPHSSDQMALLLKPPVEVCLGCHPDIPKERHAVTVFSGASHPVGLPISALKTENVATAGTVTTKAENVATAGTVTTKAEVKILMDPARPDKVFYCGSCHNPHSTETPNLFRFNATSAMGLCSHCHKM